jgi:hypothetical protein
MYWRMLPYKTVSTAASMPFYANGLRFYLAQDLSSWLAQMKTGMLAVTGCSSMYSVTGVDLMNLLFNKSVG